MMGKDKNGDGEIGSLEVRSCLVHRCQTVCVCVCVYVGGVFT